MILPRSRRSTERFRSEVAGALSRESDGIRADEALPLQSEEEGAKVDLVECSEPRQEVLHLR